MKALMSVFVMFMLCAAGCDSSFNSKAARNAGALDPFPPGESNAPPTVGGGEPGIAIGHSEPPASAETHGKAGH